MVPVLAVAGIVYVAVVVYVCARIGHELDGLRGLALGVLFGPLGLVICAMLRLSDQLRDDLGHLDQSIEHLDHAMSSLMPWSRPKPRRPPA